MMATERIDRYEELRAVRRTLETLAEARLLWPLTDDEQARYEQLCRHEQDLLTTISR